MTSLAGWKPDTVVEPGPLKRERYAGVATLPRRFGALSAHVGGSSPAALPVLNQNPTQRCVVYSAAEVLWARLAWLGLPPKLLNIRHGYVLAQRKEQDRVLGQRGELADVGLHPRDLVDALTETGATFVDGPDDAELDPARVLEDVYVDEVQAAAEYVISGWRRVPDAPSEPFHVAHEAKLLLFAGFPGMAGFDLTKPFLSYRGGVYERDPQAPSVGRHMLSVHGWDDDIGTEGAFLCLNHYGPGSDLRGWVWVGYRTFGGYHARDRYFLDFKPKA